MSKDISTRAATPESARAICPEIHSSTVRTRGAHEEPEGQELRRLRSGAQNVSSAVYTDFGLGCAQGARYGRRSSRFASASPITAPAA